MGRNEPFGICPAAHSINKKPREIDVHRGGGAEKYHNGRIVRFGTRLPRARSAQLSVARNEFERGHIGSQTTQTSRLRGILCVCDGRSDVARARATASRGRG